MAVRELSLIVLKPIPTSSDLAAIDEYLAGSHSDPKTSAANASFYDLLLAHRMMRALPYSNELCRRRCSSRLPPTTHDRRTVLKLFFQQCAIHALCLADIQVYLGQINERDNADELDEDECSDSITNYLYAWLTTGSDLSETHRSVLQYLTGRHPKRLKSSIDEVLRGLLEWRPVQNRIDIDVAALPRHSTISGQAAARNIAVQLTSLTLYSVIGVTIDDSEKIRWNQYIKPILELQYKICGTMVFDEDLRKLVLFRRNDFYTAALQWLKSFQSLPESYHYSVQTRDGPGAEKTWIPWSELILWDITSKEASGTVEENNQCLKLFKRSIASLKEYMCGSPVNSSGQSRLLFLTGSLINLCGQAEVFMQLFVTAALYPIKDNDGEAYVSTYQTLFWILRRCVTHNTVTSGIDFHLTHCLRQKNQTFSSADIWGYSDMQAEARAEGRTLSVPKAICGATVTAHSIHGSYSIGKPLEQERACAAMAYFISLIVLPSSEQNKNRPWIGELYSTPLITKAFNVLFEYIVLYKGDASLAFLKTLIDPIRHMPILCTFTEKQRVSIMDHLRCKVEKQRVPIMDYLICKAEQRVEKNIDTRSFTQTLELLESLTTWQWSWY